MEDLPKGLANSGAIDIAKRLRIISGGKVLDVATQGGGFINTLMKIIKDYESFVGIDLTSNKFKSAIKEFKEEAVEFKEMNAENLEYQNNTFDTVSISHSLHHLANIEKVLAEMKRVLKPGGHFIVQESYRDGEQTETQRTEILQHHWGSEIDRLLGESHNNTLRRREIKNFVNSVGLREFETFYSTHYVKCLFCDDKFDCEDPKDEGNLKFSIKEIDDDLKRLEDFLALKVSEESTDLKNLLKERKRLTDEAEKLKTRNKEIGKSIASVLFLVGIK